MAQFDAGRRTSIPRAYYCPPPRAPTAVELGIVLRIGTFQLDIDNQQLLRGGTEVSISPKALLVLIFLAARPGQLVTKQHLLDEIWPDTFVQEGVLKSYIKEIRKALEDDAGDPRFIRTEHRRGYRFLAGTAVQPPRDKRGVLIGRDSVLESLDRTLSTAKAGSRRLVFVAGEPGIGKTKVLNTFLDTVNDPGVRIGRGQCVEQAGAGEPYLPFFDVFSGLCREQNGGDIVDVLRQHAPTWLVQMPSLLTPTERERLRHELAGSGQQRMMREMSEAISFLAREKPLILALEDLHWSDASSIDLLSALAGRDDGARLLLLATYRPVDVILSKHPVRALKQALHAKGLCTELALELLSEEQIELYLRGRFGPELASRLTRRLHVQTEGNPLFLTRVADYLIEQELIVERDGSWQATGLLDERAGAVPESLRQMIEKQFERLAKHEQQVLEFAAVAGVEFDIDTIASGSALPSGAVEEVCESLAQGQSFLRYVSQSQSTTRFAFVHALYRDAIYAGIAGSRRRRFHLAIAQHCERQSSAEFPPFVAAQHFESAGDLGAAARNLRAAAIRAWKDYAPKEALRHVERAMALDPSDGPWIETHSLRAALLRSSGDPELAVAEYEAVADRAHNLGQIEQQVRALLDASIALLWFDRPKCLSIVDRAVEASKALGAESWLSVHASGYRAFWQLYLIGWTPEEARTFDAARNDSRIAAEPALDLLYSMLAAAIACLHSDYLGVQRHVAHGASLSVELPDPHDRLTSEYFPGVARLHSGELGAAITGFRAAASTAIKADFYLAVGLYRLGCAWVECEAGDFQTAQASAEPIFHHLRTSPSSVQAGSLVLSAQLLAGALMGQGQMEDAGGILEQAEAVVAAKGMMIEPSLALPFRMRRAAQRFAVNDLEGAARQAERALELTVSAPEVNYLALAHRMLAEVALRSGRVDEALQHVGKARQAIDSLPNSLAGWRVLLTASRCASAAGDPAQSRELAMRAVSAVDALADSLRGEPRLRECFLQQPDVRSLFA